MAVAQQCFGVCGLLSVVVAAAAALAPGWALGTLNLHELSELKYGIEIGADPVMAGQVWVSGLV